MKKTHLSFREYLQRQTIAMNHPVHVERSRKFLKREPNRRELHDVWAILCAKFFARRYFYTT